MLEVGQGKLYNIWVDRHTYVSPVYPKAMMRIDACVLYPHLVDHCLPIAIITQDRYIWK